MTKNVLKIISNAMDALNIEYDFVRYNKHPIPETYFVGEYTETASMTEDGLQEATFMLTGFSRAKSWLTLENAKDQIEQYFNRVYGKTVMMADGSAACVFYDNALIVPTGDAELKSMQINLSVKEWRVN